MLRIWGNCGTEKPIIRVGIMSALPDNGPVAATAQPEPFNIVQCRALIDTGADGTSIVRSLARTSGFRSLGKRPVVGVGGSNFHRTWAVYLGFFPEESQSSDQQGGLRILDEPLLAVEIPDNQWFEVIIGRDVLNQCDFSLKRGGDFELIVP